MSSVALSVKRPKRIVFDPAARPIGLDVAEHLERIRRLDSAPASSRSGRPVAGSRLMPKPRIVPNGSPTRASACTAPWKPPKTIVVSPESSETTLGRGCARS